MLATHTALKLPLGLGEVNLPLQWVLLVGCFHYHSRVLDAWVEEHAQFVRDGFLKKDTVRDRQIHVELPVRLDGRWLPRLEPCDLRKHLENRQCLLVWGEGGSGKTSIACRIAQWGMSGKSSQRISPHRTLPVLIQHDLETRGSDRPHPLTDAIRGQLEALTGTEEPMPDEFLLRLLRKRRVLVIVDGLSEMNKETRDLIRLESPGFPVHTMIVTSRRPEQMSGASKLTIQPMRVKGDQISSFMEGYLTQRGKRDSFKDLEYFEACTRLSRMVGDRSATVLLAKLFAEQMIASKERPSDSKLPETVPDLMLSYLNELNRNIRGDKLLDREVHRVAKLIAWDCLKDTLRPGAASIVQLEKVLGGTKRTDATVTYLEERLRIVQTVRPAQDRIRFSLDPLAEYFAAMYVVSRGGRDRQWWRTFLDRTDQVEGSPEAIQEFLGALLDCCLHGNMGAETPHAVVQELRHRVG